MNYKQARGAIPWKPGDKKPEATIRRLRNGEPKGMTMDKIDELINAMKSSSQSLKWGVKDNFSIDFFRIAPGRLRNGEPKGMTMDKIDELINAIKSSSQSLKWGDDILSHAQENAALVLRAALRAEFSGLLQELDDERAGRPLLAKATDRINDLQQELAALQERTGVCNWTYDDSGNYWHTGCGQDFVLEIGSPKENDMRFCSYCGKHLVEVIQPEDLEEL